MSPAAKQKSAKGRGLGERAVRKRKPRYVESDSSDDTDFEKTDADAPRRKKQAVVSKGKVASAKKQVRPASKNTKKRAAASDSDSSASFSGSSSSGSDFEDENEEDDYDASASASKDDDVSSEDESFQEDVQDDVVRPAKIKVPVPKGSPFADALSPDTLKFLALLIENNNRPFFKAHEDMWKKAKQDFMDFCDMFGKELRAMDPTLREEETKIAMYRIQRDIRFATEPTPYKERLMVSYSTQGKRSEMPGYHLIISPGGKSLLAVGVRNAPAALIQRIRSGIARQAQLLRDSLSTDTVKQVFDGKCGTALLRKDDSLKVAPKGYPKDHEEIKLLRLKSMMVVKYFTDEQVVSEGFMDLVLDTAEALLPFLTVVNSWL